VNVAIIPARSGSKRIPGKNIKQFCDKPMIAYPIETATSSKYIEQVIVSTDSEEIANIALEYDALVPFKRPKELSDNFTPTVPVIAHAVNMLIETGLKIENVCCIYPCTPLLKSRDIDDVYEIFISQEKDFVYPVIPYTHPIQRAMRMSDFGEMEFLFPQNELTRTQDLERTYHDAGQFYWGTVEAWLEQKKMHTDGIGVPIESWKVIDIDEEEDWDRAELLKKALG